MLHGYILLLLMLGLATNISGVKFSDIPNTIVQYGSPRTATTLQFQTVCLMMVSVLLRYNKLDQLYCKFTGKVAHDKVVNLTHYTVWKTHDPMETPNYPLWMFTTVNPKVPKTNHNEYTKEHKIDVKFTASTEQLGRYGLYLTWHYQPVFGLNSTEMNLVMSYLRYWDILRVCCGVQMSGEWRDFLLHYYPHDFDGFDEKNVKLKKRAPWDLIYPACEIYDVDAVAMRLLGHPLAKEMLKHEALRKIVRPSERDEPLTLTYCSAINKRIHDEQLEFNALHNATKKVY